MQRFISLISILTCLIMCLGVVGCSKANSGGRRTSRNTISLNDLYSGVTGQSVVGGSSFNNTSNSSSGTVNGQSNNGSTPSYLLGEVVEGNGSSTNNVGNGSNGGNSIVGGNAAKGIEYLLERTVSCSELNPLVDNYYNLYFKNDEGSQVIANRISLPGLRDGDEIKNGNEYAFVYSEADNKWICI